VNTKWQTPLNADRFENDQCQTKQGIVVFKAYPGSNGKG